MTTTIETATAATAAAEALEPGAEFAEVIGRADTSIATLRAEAAARIFPTAIPPITEATLGVFTLLTASITKGVTRGVEMAKLHARALAGDNEELAAQFRTPEMLRDIASHASRYVAAASPHDTIAAAQARTSTPAIAAYQALIARQLAAAAGHELNAAAIDWLRAFELEPRLAAAKARLEAHAKHELAVVEKKRIEVEFARRREADAAAEAERTERRAAEMAAKAALRAARGRRAAVLAEQIAAHKLVVLRAGEQRVFDAKQIAAGARRNGFSDDQLAEFEGALEYTLRDPERGRERTALRSARPPRPGYIKTGQRRRDQGSDR